MRGYILKNTGEFNFIKPAKGLDLRQFTSKPRENSSTGISTESYGSKWFELPKGEAIFKTYDGFFASSVRNMRIVNEVLCYELANLMGIECAEYEAAHMDNDTGLVSYSVLGNIVDEVITMQTIVEERMELDPKARRSFFLESEDRCVKKILESLDFMKEQGFYRFDREKIIIDLYKMIVFDFLTFQTDRHLANIHLIKNCRTIKLSPLIDNEFAFGGLALNRYDERQISSLRAFMNNSSLMVRQVGIYENVPEEQRMKNICTQILTFAKHNPEAKEILSDMMAKFNIRKALKIVEEKGFKINPEYKEYLISVCDYTKQMVKYYAKHEDEMQQDGQTCPNNLTGEDELTL